MMRVIGGTLKGRTILTPKGDETRPTSSRLRETVFNMLQFEIEGAAFLDLFSGSGAMAIEALSRGAKQATLVDQSPEAFQTIKKNLTALNLEKQATPLRADYLDALKRLTSKGIQFDILFADAPYELDPVGQKLLDFAAEHPLLKPHGKIFIENSQKTAPSHPRFELISSRKSGKTYLHEFKHLEKNP